MTLGTSLVSPFSQAMGRPASGTHRSIFVFAPALERILIAETRSKDDGQSLIELTARRANSDELWAARRLRLPALAKRGGPPKSNWRHPVFLGLRTDKKALDASYANKLEPCRSAIALDRMDG